MPRTGGREIGGAYDPIELHDTPIDRAQQRLLLFLLDHAEARAKLDRMRLTTAEYDALQCRVSGTRTQKRRLKRVDEAVALLQSCGFQP
ncbi:MAG TPA: hypothetical protein PLI98_13420 [Candidatus Hydrogenedentes bacterium]|nr:hypothetical protein [Candidatus Hydrogenedentota bacterium]